MSLRESPRARPRLLPRRARRGGTAVDATGSGGLPAQLLTTLAGGSMHVDAATARPAAPPGMPTQRVGRNEPCPCGSGKKFKHCHGKLS